MSDRAGIRDEAGASAHSTHQDVGLVVTGTELTNVSLLGGAVHDVNRRPATAGSDVADPDRADTNPEVSMLGLPDGITTCLFDLDGVLTDTAAVHNIAWKATFDGYLRERAKRTGEPFVPFNPGEDYNTWVDGKKREDGVRSFLGSRGIVLPEGSLKDAPGTETVYGIGNRKNELLLKTIDSDGVRVYEGSRRYLEAAAEAGLRRAVVSSSVNAEQILEVTGLAQFIELRVDGLTARKRNLAGKPAPDTFLAATADLRVKPSQAVVFEDALSGVEAGRAGEFGHVVGVDRVGQAAALHERGADAVVQDLAEMLA